MRILVVEDEPKMSAAIRRVLTAERHAVDVADDGVGALALAGERDYDVIVLDRMLPDLDGLEVLGLLRSRGVSTPVLMLTALGALDHRVAGLDAGSDDYLPKPFAFAELLARLRALARRAPDLTDERLNAGDIVLDPVRHRVTVGAGSEDLSAREYALLGYLIRQEGRVVTRQQTGLGLGGGTGRLLQCGGPVRPLPAPEARDTRAQGRAADGAGRRIRTVGRYPQRSMRVARPAGKAWRTQRDPTERLVAQTQRRLAAFTLLLVTALLVGVGIATALVATRLMDANVDRALEAAAAAVMQPSSDGAEGLETEHSPNGADTFVLALDAGGKVLANPNGVVLQALPDANALAAAAMTGRDIRSGTYGGIDIRILTVPASPSSGEDDGADGPGFIQAGFVLTLHEQQESQLLWTIAMVSLVGLAGAALVTVLVTRRALVPIRAAFATERRFVAAASHELRTPVAIVRASAEILDREGLVRQDGQPFVADIMSEADRLGRLVGDLLALASEEATAVEVALQQMDVVVWLSDLGRRAESMAWAHGLTLQTTIPADAPVMVDADPDRLTQLVLILVDNAIEHSPSDGTVTLDLAVAAGWALVSVSDQGPGVPVSERERIFEPFARLPGERRSASGSGLGLAIARRLAGRHGGDITVEDAPGGGARFVLRLALRPGSVAGGTAAPTPVGTGLPDVRA